MKHELGLSFSPRNLPIKFGTDPSTIFLVIVVTDRQTHKPMPVKTYYLTFAGRIRYKVPLTVHVTIINSNQKSKPP